MLDRVKGIEHGEEDLKNEEETSSGVDQPEEKAVEQEEDTSTNEAEAEVQQEPDYKAELEKTRMERDNYKEGLLALKSKKRELINEPKEETEEVEETEVEPDNIESKVEAVLYKQNERKALREVITESSQSYMPELVDDNQYKEIINYLPRIIDRSSVEGVTRALKVAVNSWKMDRGITESPKKDRSGEIATMKSTPSGKTNNNTKTERKRIIPKVSSYDNWYK